MPGVGLSSVELIQLKMVLFATMTNASVGNRQGLEARIPQENPKAETRVLNQEFPSATAIQVNGIGPVNVLN
jgi:hypothetical protein